MKQLIFSCIFVLGFSSLPIFMSGADAQENYQLSISGKIDGLMPNDTLSFRKTTLPYKGREGEATFNVIVSDPNKFFYPGKQPHTQYYSMMYKPASGGYQVSSRQVLMIIVGEGSYYLKGETDFIYYSTISGGLYNDPSLKEIVHPEDSLEIIRTKYGKIIDEARKKGDMEKAKEYVGRFDRFRSNHQGSYTLLWQRIKELIANNPSSIWATVEYLQEVSYAVPEEMKSVLSNTNQEAPNSYYGQIFRWEVEVIERLAPGNEAPLFSATTTDGKRIISGDARSKYLLLHHWGLCLGSISVDKRVTAFYEKYKDHLSAIGITDDIETICGLNKNVGEDDGVLGMKPKPVPENMAVHPQPEVESKGDNHKAIEDFTFTGLPYFVFISPDGKITSRDFHKVFDKAQEVMRSESGD